MTDEDLEELAALARDDTEAFGRLYDRLAPDVYRYVRGLVGSDHVAEDVCEDVFLAALESLPRYSPRGGGVRAWIFRIARNDVLDHFRKTRRARMEPLDALAERADPDAGGDVTVERIAEVDRVRAALVTLTRDQREVLLMRFGADLPIADIARVTGKTEGAVKALQHRGLESLAATLRLEEWRDDG